jgi:hypothetical protein
VEWVFNVTVFGSGGDGAASVQEGKRTRMSGASFSCLEEVAGAYRGDDCADQRQWQRPCLEMEDKMDGPGGPRGPSCARLLLGRGERRWRLLQRRLRYEDADFLRGATAHAGLVRWHGGLVEQTEGLGQWPSCWLGGLAYRLGHEQAGNGRTNRKGLKFGFRIFENGFGLKTKEFKLFESNF